MKEKNLFSKFHNDLIQLLAYSGLGRKILVRVLSFALTWGGSRFFSRGGGFLTTFLFRSAKMLFRAVKKTLFCRKLLRRQIFEKIGQKSSFLALLENVDKKIPFFWRALPLTKLVYIGAKGAFRKILGPVDQKSISEKVPKGGPFGSAGVESLKTEASAPAPPPKSAPGFNTKLSRLT